MVKARNRKTNVKQVVLGAIWLNRLGSNECIHRKNIRESQKGWPNLYSCSAKLSRTWPGVVANPFGLSTCGNM